VRPRRAFAVTKRHAYELRHSPPGLFDMLFWPVIDLIIWGTLTVFIERQGATLPLPIGFLLGGVLLWDFVFRSNLGIGIAFLDDTSWTHNVLNLLVSPLRAGEYLAGIAAWSLFKVLCGWVIMATIAVLLFAFGVFALGPALALFALALMLFGVALGLVVIGVVLRFGPGADIMVWGLAVLLMPLSAVFYPVSALPGWGQAIAAVLPTAHVFEAMREVLAGRALPADRLVKAFALDAVYLLGGLAFARAMFSTLRRRGFVTRYMT
jgi:ABC-2 type transport system permease protein